MEAYTQWIESHMALSLWIMSILLGGTLVAIIYVAVKNTLKNRRFQKDLKIGDTVRYASERGAVGKVSELTEDDAVIVIKVKREDLIMPNE